MAPRYRCWEAEWFFPVRIFPSFGHVVGAFQRFCVYIYIYTLQLKIGIKALI